MSSSINDQPITKLIDNKLGIENYADALAEFINSSATPLTIGIQGEWGTGKTSLMFMIKELLHKSIVTSWVNTWEYSLFKSAAETTPSVLKGLLENLIDYCKDKGYWKNEQKYNEVKDQVMKGLEILGKMAVNAASRYVTGADAPIPEKQQLTSEIADIKKKIQKIINLLEEDKTNPVEKVVFFVDDLDRIDPPVAVEILEALKNVFDIEKCVFILAIDYDIVIKGLEKKFGLKTDSNEREFRSFFDKIIQLPFTMPVSAYKIDNLLKANFETIALDIPGDIEADYIKIVQLTVGYSPRSIKRYINSYSLLRSIRSLDPDYKSDPLNDFCLFAMIGIQISYPPIFRLISKQSNFLMWDEIFAKQNNVDEIIVPEREHKFTDEKWEQFIWSFCQKEIYLTVKAFNIIETLNILRDKLGENLEDIIENSMAFASITTVDDDTESKQAKPFQHIELNNLDEYITNPKNNFNGVKFAQARELILFIHDKIKSELPGVIFKYSPTGGATIYIPTSGRSKFAGLAFYSYYVELALLRDFRRDYKKPAIEGMEILNRRNNSGFIDWYKIIITDLEQFKKNEGKILNLLRESKEMKEKYPGKVLKEKDFSSKNDALLSKYLDPEYTYSL